MKILAVVLFCVALVLGACFQSVRNRVCVSTSTLETNNGLVTVFQSKEAVLIAYKLASPPDLSGLVTEEDKGFIEMFSLLDAVSVITNIDQMRKENGYTFAQLGDATNGYAEDHMKVYVRSRDDTWYSIKIPDYC